jgi:tripartite motif-containing protein 71
VAIAVACALGALLAFAPASFAFEPLLQFGSSGSNPGELAFPSRLAIDSAQNLYVEEYDNDRISVFSPGGTFLRSIGTSGSGAGQLDSPFGTTIAPNGHVYVVDQNNNRINEFMPDGSFVKAWGYNVDPSGGSGNLEVCTSATGCQGGVPGGAAGQLDDPSGIGADAAGNLFVGEQDADRVDEFTPAGDFVKGWGYNVDPSGGSGNLEVCTTATGCQAGVSGSGPGQLEGNTDVKIDRAGNVLAADTNNNRINKYTTDGAFISSFGTFGIGPGQLKQPTAIVEDASGNLYLSEQDNARVSEFNAAGDFIRAFGQGVIDGSAAFQVCTAGTGCQAGSAGTTFGAMSSPEGVVVDCRGAVYATDSDGNRVQRFGEAGTRLAPCPSNQFSLGKVRRNKKKGTAVLPVTVSGPGQVTMSGKGVKRVAVASAGSTVELRIKSKGKVRKKLSGRGRAKVNVKVTFTPTNGDPNTQGKKLVLLKKRSR